jgi:hypothetical protein
MEGFGQKNQSKIRSSLKRAMDYNIQIEVVPVSDTFFEWFLPMYEARINSKDNPNVIPIIERVKKAQKQYYALILKENDIPLGATIFSLTDTDFSIAWRTYSNNWTSAKLPVNPSKYTEYICEELAIRYNCSYLVHGKDSNPYGLHSSIGLAAFKFGVGSQPSKAKKYELHTIDTDKLDTDALIFEYPGDTETDIKKGYLVTSRETEHKWSQVTTYAHLVEIETIYRD